MQQREQSQLAVPFEGAVPESPNTSCGDFRHNKDTLPPPEAHDRTIFDEPHHQSLEFLCTQALIANDPRTAFRLADRRCRILPLPEPHCFVLRGDAAFKLGARDVAIGDIESALEIEPDNIVANRRMLDWATGPRQRKAASALIAHERNPDVLRKAAHILTKSGEKYFASLTILDDAVEGWALWPDDAPIEVSIVDDVDTLKIKVSPDRSHPLADFGCAAGFRIQRPRSKDLQSIFLAVSGAIFYAKNIGGNNPGAETALSPQRVADPGGHRRVTVIVPIFRDYRATKRCLDSLIPELGYHRAILIDDASPDPKIKQLAAECSNNICIDLIVNRRNLGFVSSVNRALAKICQGDVILLNADTIVTPGFIDRLAKIARSHPDIGTLTPLTNNGEFTSFPTPNTANLLGRRTEIEAIDSIASKANDGQAIDIPAGIGFCLYITRSCLDSIGRLSDDFGAGYLEDADFCLRARQQGFRNVCAPSVYIGHAGSKSFGTQKRSLVMRNLRVLEGRWPKHRNESAAFMAADPLRAAREAIERTAFSISRRPQILITSPGTLCAVARERARHIKRRGSDVLICAITEDGEGPIAQVANIDRGIPQSLQFRLSERTGHTAFVEYIRRIKPSRIEICDPAILPGTLAADVRHLKIPYDILVGAGGVLGSKAGKLRAAAADVATDTRAIKHRSHSPVKGEGRTYASPYWLNIIDGARRIIAPCRHSAAFARAYLAPRSMTKLELSGTRQRKKTRSCHAGSALHVGFVPVRVGAHEHALMTDLAKRLVVALTPIPITIIGATLDDIQLMRTTNAFVTGSVDANDLERLITLYGLTHIFLCPTQPLFGHPMIFAIQELALPTAYFDWSRGHLTPDRRDLAIDPMSSPRLLADALSQWMR